MKNRNKKHVLDHHECNEVVKKKLAQDSMEEYSLLSYKIIPLDSTSGYMGEYFTLEATVAQPSFPLEEKILNFFVKIPPPSDSPQQQFNLEHGSFKKEIDLYTQVFPQLLNGDNHLHIPQCFVGLEDNLIILEDMSSTGYIMPDKLIPFDFDHCKIILASLAKLHVQSFIFEELHKKNLHHEFHYCLHETLWPAKEGVGKKAFRAAVKGIISMSDLITDLDVSQRVELKENLVRLTLNHTEKLKPSRKYRNVICHGDLWANNILLKYDDDKKPISCCFIDFQLARYNPPAHDVLCFLYFTTTRQLRANHSMELYKFYYNQLVLSLEKAQLNHSEIFSWEDFDNSIKDLRLMHIVHAILNVNCMILHPKILGEYFQKPKMLEEALYIDRTPLICAQFQEITDYRQRMIGLMLDLYDEIKD